MRTDTRRRTAARSSIVGHGCSAYSSPPAALSSSVIARTAVSTSHAMFASTRIAPAGPSASRTASTRAQSSDSDDRVSATFTFAVRQPDALTSSYAFSALTTGTVVFTSTRSRTGAGQPSSLASTAACSHGRLSASE